MLVCWARLRNPARRRRGDEGGTSHAAVAVTMRCKCASLSLLVQHPFAERGTSSVIVVVVPRNSFPTTTETTSKAFSFTVSLCTSALLASHPLLSTDGDQDKDDDDEPQQTVLLVGQ